MLHVSILSKEWQVVNCERFHEKKKGRGPFPSDVFCFLGWSWMWFVPPVWNIYVDFIRHAYSCWVSKQSGERICWALCQVHPESGYGLLPCLCAFQIYFMVCARQWFLNWSVLRKNSGKADLSIFTMCLLLFVYMFICLFVCFLNSAFLGSLFVTFMYKTTLKQKSCRLRH